MSLAAPETPEEKQRAADLDTGFETGWDEAQKTILDLAKDHYWDSLQSEKEIILDHIRAIIAIANG